MNPIDYKLQDPDAMRYALMQNSSYRGGGGVRMAAGGLARKMAKATEEVMRIIEAERNASKVTDFGKLDYDPRFDPRTKEQDRIKGTTTTIEKRGDTEAPSVSLANYEGHPFITSMSDRTAAGGALVDINGVPLKRPINLQGGQDYMFDNPGQVWASAENPVNAMMIQANAMKALTGKDPLYMPWRMAPTGGDFAHMTGETMLSFAESNMGKGTKRSLDKQIKQFIPDWKGIDSSESIDQYRAAPDVVRKGLKNMMDVGFRNEGGLNIGQARLSVADPSQVNAPDAGLMNVGRIFADSPIIQQSGHVSYPRGVPGEGIGRLENPHSVFELLPDVVRERGIPDVKSPRQTDIRALQMKPYMGIIDDKLLNSLGYKDGGAVRMANGGGISIDDIPAPDPFSVNSKPSTLAYTNASTTPYAAPEQKTHYDERMNQLTEQLNRGVKPDWMSVSDFANDQISRGNSKPGHMVRALGDLLELPEKVLGASIDPMMGAGVATMGEAAMYPGMGRFAVDRYAAPVAEKALTMFEQGRLTPGISPTMGAVENKGVTPKVLAPANEMGFYSPTEAAALNLQRKSGNGQAFLNDLLKQENVRTDEINAMGLDTFLKGNPNVTADEMRDYIAKNKIQLGEAKYGELTPLEQAVELERLAQNEYGKPFGELDGADRRRLERQVIIDTKDTKFKQWSMPGGENYREVVLTMPTKTVSEDEARVILGAKPDAKLTQADINYASRKNAQEYQSSHWDEPNVLAHLRMSDRVTDGKKTLLVDEVQSDWHQAGREQGYRGDVPNLTPEQETRREELGDKIRRGLGTLAEIEESKILRDQMAKKVKAVPDAPYKDDWYQLALRRAVKEAVDNGYDRVALPTGQRVAERFDLSKQIDRIDYNKNEDGTYSMSAIKNGREVFSKEDLDEKELSGIVGKDVAKKIVGDEGSSAPKADRWESEDGDVPEFKSLSGLDLQVGGEGMKKYYDEIYPGYLKKFGKKYGATVGTTEVEVPPDSKAAYQKLRQYEGSTEYINGRITWSEFLAQHPEAAKDFTEPLHYMDITPAMRKEFSTGIHMKKGGKVTFANDLDAMRHELTRNK